MSFEQTANTPTKHDRWQQWKIQKKTSSFQLLGTLLRIECRNEIIYSLLDVAGIHSLNCSNERVLLAARITVTNIIYVCMGKQTPIKNEQNVFASLLN